MNSTINRLDSNQSNELNPIKTSPLLPPLKSLLMSRTRFQALSGSCAWKMRQLGAQPAVLMIILMWASGVESNCRTGCDLALASYYVWEGANLTFVSKMFSTPIDNILTFSPEVTNSDYIEAGTRINIPFTCDCIGRQFLGHSFSYQVTTGDNYRRIAERYYANLSTVEWLQRSNSYDVNNIPNVDAEVNVVVNCSCGDWRVSSDYGLFVTYPLRPGQNLSGIANEFGVASELLQRYNVGSDFGNGSGLVFIPAKDQTGNFPPLKISPVAGIARGVIVGISVGGAAVALCLAFILYVRFYKRKKVVETSLLPQATQGPGTAKKPSKKSAAIDCNSPQLNGIAVNKTVEFSYKELAKATNDFSIANKIGQGGFGAVYYAELRGEKAAIKKMDMQASQEFHAELKVLTHVHHLNLVRLIGYCTEGSLFLVYEFIENGNLSQHLHGSGDDALPWSTRMKIAIDSARGLEYIHEHTVPVYIHRDIKSSNILIDRNFRAKIADFGLTKLTKLGKTLLHAQVEGTFGYMPPEYITYGDVSSKLDVYAFGVVLYELISGKEAIVRINESVTEYKGLNSLFEDAFSQPDPNEALRKLVDPRLGDNYLLDSVIKIAQLARACTQDDPKLRPSMGAILVALMTLLSSTGDWDVKLFNQNQVLVNLTSGN